MGYFTSELFQIAETSAAATSQGKKNDVAGCCDPPPEIVIALFFDGTGNNSTVEAKMHKNTVGTDNPPNDFSNITKLYDLYQQQNGVYPRYIEGIGTFDGAEDDEDYTVAGQGFGLGKYGGAAKVKIARKHVMDTLWELEGCKPAKITFDIFGFSRGAALARHFVNVILAGLPDFTQKNARARKDFVTMDGYHIHPEGTPLGNLLYVQEQAKDAKTGKSEDATFVYPALDAGIVEIRFLGLFDTVGSFGLPGNANDLNFILTVPKSGQIKKIVHLVANHERRDNFKAVLVGNDLAEEIVMAGVHSDIGGGYPKKCTQQIVVDASDLFVIDILNRGGKQRDALEKRARARGLYESGELKPGYSINLSLLQPATGPVTYFRWVLLRDKIITNEYANVCLRVMFNKALESGLPMDKEELESPAREADKGKYSISAELEPFVQNPPAEVDTEKVWEPYLHLSAVDIDPKHPYAARPLGYYTESVTTILSFGLQDNPEGPRMVFDNNKKPGFLGS